MLGWMFFSLVLLSANGMEFPQEADEVAGLLEIRRYGVVNVMIPEVQRLRQQYLDAYSAALGRNCTVPPSPQFQSCADCIRKRCLGRAAHICSTNRYFDARKVINNFISVTLPTLLSPAQSNLSADDLLVDFEQYARRYRSAVRGKRAAAVSEPYCPELRKNETACSFYLSACPCFPICVSYLQALEALERLQYAIPGFLSGYKVEMFMLDLTTFDREKGGFMTAKARVKLAGDVFEFFCNHPALPYSADTMGPLIAQRALMEYYLRYPTRNTSLDSITG